MSLTKNAIINKLKSLNQTRQWLAKASGYDYMTVNNKLGPSGKITDRMMSAFERAILEEERRHNIDTTSAGKESVWDLVMFSGREVSEINEGRRLGGYDKVEDLFHDAIIDYCDSLTSKEWDEPA